jgi:hypothetical protein
MKPPRAASAFLPSSVALCFVFSAFSQLFATAAALKDLDPKRVHYLSPEDSMRITDGSGLGGVSKKKKEFDVFCFQGFPAISPQHIFTSVKVSYHFQ